MGEDFPPETAFDSSGNPLFTGDGNLASAADASEYPTMPLFVYGEQPYSGTVYDGWGHQVRVPSEESSVDWDVGAGGTDPGAVVGGAAASLFIAFFLMLVGPLDRWLMGMAQNQSDRSNELKHNLEAIKGLNFGALLATTFFIWIWPFFFMRFSMALVVALLMTMLPLLVPCMGPMILIMTVLIIVRGNEWSWYSGKWDTIDDFKKAKKRWIYTMIVVYAVIGVIGILNWMASQ